MKIDIYNDEEYLPEELETLPDGVDFYYQDEPYAKSDLLVEFTLSQVISDNALKKVKAWGKGMCHTPQYEKWIIDSKKELESQGHKAETDQSKLYDDHVLLEIEYHHGKTQKGDYMKRHKDAGNVRKSVEDLIQYLYKDHVEKKYRTRNKIKELVSETIVIDRDWGFFIQDDKQVKYDLVKCGKSTIRESLTIRIYKAKKL